MTEFTSNFYLLWTLKIINSSYFYSFFMYLKAFRSYFDFLFAKLPLIIPPVFLQTFLNCWPSVFSKNFTQSWNSVYFKMTFLFICVYASRILVSSHQDGIDNVGNYYNLLSFLLERSLQHLRDNYSEYLPSFIPL